MSHSNKTLLSVVIVCLMASMTAASSDYSFKDAVFNPEQKWEFRNDGGVLGHMYFAADGTIREYSHPNEHRWSWEGNTLVFRSTANRITCKFVNTWRDGDLYWRADGLFLGHTINGWRHYLIEKDD